MCTVWFSFRNDGIDLVYPDVTAANTGNALKVKAIFKTIYPARAPSDTPDWRKDNHRKLDGMQHCPVCLTRTHMKTRAAGKKELKVLLASEQ
ncbi:hypothetical protein KIPB_017200 [Kipferlia bialata]|uniref:Uncharacterized protein n=1 Tax=Kipferlia bialata TaxID=797122 RepID=A0A391NWG9_9EUKA|nr:hypothetical protein KIPB_017200 [Kipferlia bialata]|eukprot:g17200.t1